MSTNDTTGEFDDEARDLVHDIRAFRCGKLAGEHNHQHWDICNADTTKIASALKSAYRAGLAASPVQARAEALRSALQRIATPRKMSLAENEPLVIAAWRAWQVGIHEDTPQSGTRAALRVVDEFLRTGVVPAGGTTGPGGGKQECRCVPGDCAFDDNVAASRLANIRCRQAQSPTPEFGL